MHLGIPNAPKCLVFELCGPFAGSSLIGFQAVLLHLHVHLTVTISCEVTFLILYLSANSP